MLSQFLSCWQAVHQTHSNTRTNPTPPAIFSECCTICEEEITCIEECLCQGQANDILSTVFWQLWIQAVAYQYKSRAITSQCSYSQSQDLEQGIEFQILWARHQYMAACNALSLLRVPGEWEKVWRELHPEDIRGLNGSWQHKRTKFISIQGRWWGCWWVILWRSFWTAFWPRYLARIRWEMVLGHCPGFSTLWVMVSWMGQLFMIVSYHSHVNNEFTYLQVFIWKRCAEAWSIAVGKRLGRTDAEPNVWQCAHMLMRG